MQLRNRLVMATQMWREATDEPLPRMPPGDPADQLQGFELKLVDMLCAQATPVKRRVVECHEGLARLSARTGGIDA
jgi:hypothetical protein